QGQQAAERTVTGDEQRREQRRAHSMSNQIRSAPALGRRQRNDSTPGAAAAPSSPSGGSPERPAHPESLHGSLEQPAGRPSGPALRALWPERLQRGGHERRR